MIPKTVAVGEFKARCLALLDGVSKTGAELLVLKRGRPLAKVVPVDPPAPIEGSVTFCGDLLAPAIAAEDWKMCR